MYSKIRLMRRSPRTSMIEQKAKVRLPFIKRFWYRECPSCRGHDVHRSERRMFPREWLIAMLFLRPFRCLDCNCRYYGLIFKRPFIP